MSYVKYTAADGTVHLCHEDSPMLMHVNWRDLNIIGITRNAIQRGSNIKSKRKELEERRKEFEEAKTKSINFINAVKKNINDEFTDPSAIMEKVADLLAEELNFKARIDGYSFHSGGDSIKIYSTKNIGKHKTVPVDTILSIIGINGQKMIKDGDNLLTIKNKLHTAVTRSKDKLTKTLDSMLKYDNSTYDFRERVEKKRR